MPYLTLSIAAISLLIAAVFGFAPEATIYQQDAIVEAQYWRLLSAHFSHTDLAHLAWNLAGLAVVGTWLEKYIGKALLVVGLIGIICIDAYLISQETLLAYCGLSALLNTFLVALLVKLAQEEKLLSAAWLTGLLAFGKIIVEMHLDQALFTHTAWPSLPEAHLAGFIGGLVWAIFHFTFKDKYHVKENQNTHRQPSLGV